MHKINEPITAGEIHEISPDLVIIDFILPWGLGDEICLEIKNYEPTKNIPVILYSASSNLDKLVSKCKADAFIEKPFDLENLISVVHDS